LCPRQQSVPQLAWLKSFFWPLVYPSLLWLLCRCGKVHVPWCKLRVIYGKSPVTQIEVALGAQEYVRLKNLGT
jgi:hypothetical protein